VQDYRPAHQRGDDGRMHLNVLGEASS